MLCFSALLIFTGCTGPKGMMRGYYQTWDSIPRQKDLSVKVKSYLIKDAAYSWEGKNAGDLFKETLVEKIERKKLFSQVTVISETESAKTSLLLEINIELLSDWDSRARSRNQEDCEIGIAGRLIDVKTDAAILTFAIGQAKSRGGTSLFGMGPVGLISLVSLAVDVVTWIAAPGSKRLINQLMEWTAEDVAEVLEKEMRK
jgi:hypothetical protein